MPFSSETQPDGTVILSNDATFTVAGASEEVATIEVPIFPAFPDDLGYGRMVHPTLGTFDYAVKPDEWVNMDGDVIIPPIWRSSQTIGGAVNTLWSGKLRDVTCEERWKGLGGISMPITMLRALVMIFTNPMDPSVGYVEWWPNYSTSLGYKVIPIRITVGGEGIVLDDVINAKNEYGDPNGWVSNPVTWFLKIADRL